MANLTVYTDRGVRSAVAKQYLDKLGIVYEEKSLDADASARQFLEEQGRDVLHFPVPQFYVGTTLAWANGYKDVANLTSDQINERVSEINAS